MWEVSGATSLSGQPGFGQSSCSTFLVDKGGNEQFLSHLVILKSEEVPYHINLKKFVPHFFFSTFEKAHVENQHNCPSSIPRV